MNNYFDHFMEAPTPSDMPSEAFKALLEYWLACKSDDDLPFDYAIDPLLLPPKSLKHICIINVERDPLQYFIKLAGTAVCDMFSSDPTGKYVHDFDGIHPDPRFTWCVDNRKPYLVKDDMSWHGKGHKSYYGLVLPFMSKEKKVSRLISAYWMI